MPSPLYDLRVLRDLRGKKVFVEWRIGDNRPPENLPKLRKLSIIALQRAHKIFFFISMGSLRLLSSISILDHVIRVGPRTPGIRVNPYSITPFPAATPSRSPSAESLKFPRQSHRFWHHESIVPQDSL